MAASTVIVRYCQHCGRYPVSVISPKCTICDLCLVTALSEAIAADEPFRCPNCETVQEFFSDVLFVCPNCGWSEDDEDDIS